MTKREIPIPIKLHRSDFPVQVKGMKERDRSNIYKLRKCISNNIDKGERFKEAAEKCGVPPKEAEIGVDVNGIITNYLKKEVTKTIKKTQDSMDRLTQIFEDLGY